MSIQHTLHAVLRTRSPLHIAHPVPGGRKLTIDLKRAPGGTGFPCTAVQTMPVLTGDGDVVRLPVIASNNLAGHLRRCGAKIVLDALAARGEQVTLNTYATLMCGAGSGNPSGADMTYSEYTKLSADPYFGLFGGGPKLAARRVRVHSALPMVREVAELRGALAHPDFPSYQIGDQAPEPGGDDAAQADAPKHKPIAKRLIETMGFRRVDDLRDLSNIALASRSIHDFERAFTERQDQIIAARSGGKEEGDARISTKTYSFMEFVVPGVPFDLTIEADVQTDAQMGLLMLSLGALAHDRIGGNVRNGFGIVSFDDVQITGPDGQVVHVMRDGVLNTAEPVIAGWIAAWQEASKSISAAALDDLALNREAGTRAAEKKAKKAKKAAASESAGGDE